MRSLVPWKATTRTGCCRGTGAGDRSPATAPSTATSSRAVEAKRLAIRAPPDMPVTPSRAVDGWNLWRR